MKKSTPCLYLGCIVIFCSIAAEPLRAQTITLGHVSTTTCAGDTLLVPYTASGTFAPDNVFKVHNSNDRGSFANYLIVGSDSSMNGVIRVPNHGQRVMVVSTDPYVLSDTSQPIATFLPPAPGISAIRSTTNVTYSNYQIGSNMSSPGIGFVGDSYKFACYSSLTGPTQINLKWQFDADAIVTPLSDSEVAVTYTKPGWKSATVSAEYNFGCPGTKTWNFYVGTCHPTIPRGARVVTDNVKDGQDSVVWVKSGGSYNGPASLVFAEPGSIVTAHGNGVVYYFKPGVSSDPRCSSLTEFGYGGIDTFYCPDLTFDYSRLDVGAAEPAPLPIALHQSGDMLTAVSNGSSLEIRIADILGAAVLSKRGLSDVDLDLGQIPAGVYFAIIQAGQQREVRRILVTH